MLLAEMVRKPISEANLVTDTGSYTSAASSHDWQDRVSKNITLTEGCYVHIKWTTTIGTSTYRYSGQSRVLIDGVPVAASGAYWASGSEYSRTIEFYVYLAAGSHTLTWQSAFSSSMGRAVTVKDIYVWRARLEDCEREQASGTSVSLPNASETTVLDYTVTPAGPRPIPVGYTKQGRLVIRCFMGAASRRDSYPKNPGESNANLSWKLYINGSQVSWTGRYDDDTGIPTTNPTWGCGTYAYYDTVYTHGTDIDVAVACYNATGSNQTGGFCYLEVFMCPWLIPTSAYQPVTIEAPQGSTLYLVLEPFSSNPTKTVKYGYVRWVSFGDSTDYYSTSSGTGILTWSYTNELVDPNKVSLSITGDGACISMIGCDIR